MQLSKVMDRIARGEASHDATGMVPWVKHPPSLAVRGLCEKPPPRAGLKSSYPRHGSEHSLQYHSRAERSAAQRVPAESNQASRSPAEAQTTEREERDPQSGLDPSASAAPCNGCTGTPAQLERVLVAASTPRTEVRAQSTSPVPRRARSTPPRSVPPRSGKSIFAANNLKPMVPASARSPVQAPPCFERLNRGEAARERQSPASTAKATPRKPADAPAGSKNLEASYPRHGSIHTLQYHSKAEHAGAHHAQSGGQTSNSPQAFTPPPRTESAATPDDSRPTPRKAPLRKQVEGQASGSAALAMRAAPHLSQKPRPAFVSTPRRALEASAPARVGGVPGHASTVA